MELKDKSPDGILHKNRATALRWMFLKEKEKEGIISELKSSTKYILIPTIRDKDGKLIEKEYSYIADITYVKDNQRVAEIVETVGTPPSYCYQTEFILRRKLLLQIHNVSLVLVYSNAMWQL